MSHLLKQSTASQEIILGRFLDATDASTEETALTIANTDIKIWKEGATSLANKNSGGGTHIANGIYYAVLDATDTDTLGNIEVHTHVSGATPTVWKGVVVTADAYNAAIGSGAWPYVKGYPYGVAVSKFAFPMWTTVGALATGKSVTATISKDGGNYASVTDTPTEIQTTGTYEVDLSATEMQAREVILIFSAAGCRDQVIKIRTQSNAG